MINVVNLIDGVDGLAAGRLPDLGARRSRSSPSRSTGPSAAVLAAVTAGGAFGFLRHGFPPASSFMGDTGSNLLGYLLGAIAVQGALKTNAVVALFFPLVVLAVPIFDTGFVIAKRLKYRRPIYLCRSLASAPSPRQHRLLAAADARLSVRLGAGHGRDGARPAIRPLFPTTTVTSTPFWTAVIVACMVVAVAASVYLVATLEILKLRRVRFRELLGARGRPPEEAEVDEGVARELETGSFEADPQTGEWAAVDPETGELEVQPPERGP